MRAKANPNLLRQTLTQLWSYNLFAQKPYFLEEIFIKTYKIVALSKNFFANCREVRLFSDRKLLREPAAKALRQNFNRTSYRLLNFSMARNGQKTIFCYNTTAKQFKNANSFTKIFSIEHSNFLLTQKFKKNSFSKKMEGVRKPRKNKIRKSKRQGAITTHLKLFLFRHKSLFQKKIYNKVYKILSIKKFKRNLKKRIFLQFNKTTGKKSWEKPNYFIYRFKTLKKQPIDKKIKLKYYNNYKRNLVAKNLGKSPFFKKYPVLFLHRKKKKKLFFLETRRLIISAGNLQKYQHFFQYQYICLQLNNIVSENALTRFISIYAKQALKTNIQFKIQQIWKDAESFKNFATLNEAIYKQKNSLKRDGKKYSKFFSTLPNLNFSQLAKTINEQFALELARTKKHWRIIRLFENFLVKYLLQLKKTYMMQSQISGLQVTIIGRPNKSNRTRKIKLHYGSCKRTVFDAVNTNKTFADANAKIGTFGITILMTL